MVFMQRDINARLNISKGWLDDFCSRWGITELAVFGSILRADFEPDSDVDVLVRFSPEVDWSLLDHVRMEEEFLQQVGRRVDLMTKRSIEQGHNWLLRKEIFDTAEMIYGSR